MKRFKRFSNYILFPAGIKHLFFRYVFRLFIFTAAGQSLREFAITAAMNMQGTAFIGKHSKSRHVAASGFLSSTPMVPAVTTAAPKAAWATLPGNKRRAIPKPRHTAAKIMGKK